MYVYSCSLMFVTLTFFQFLDLLNAKLHSKFGILLNSTTFNPKTITEDIPSLVSNGISCVCIYVCMCVYIRAWCSAWFAG